MSIRMKITIIITITACIFIFLGNLVFIKFFSNYLVTEEDVKINLLKKSTESYLSEKFKKYLGNVNDYAHWDDTYKLMDEKENIMDYYINSNLVVDTFLNLDINFMIFVREDDSIKIERYYDISNQEFIEFPVSLRGNIEKFIKASKSEKDLSTILKLGDQYYFLAASDITDSNKEIEANGTMLIGRLIDKDFINKLKELTDSNVSISAINYVGDGVTQELSWKEGDSVLLDTVRQNKGPDMMNLEYLVPNTAFEGFSVHLTFAKTRDLYKGGMDQIASFMVVYSIILLIILLIVFTLLGKYISRPITILIDELKGLDLTKSESHRLKIRGKDEFAFLRNSINSMLSKIEIEQYKVRENEEKLYATLTSVGDGVIAVDRNGIVNFMNPVAQQLTGWRQEEAYGKAFELVFNIINEFTREKVENPVEKVFEIQEVIELANHTVLVSKDGSERAIEDTAAPIKDKFGKVIGVVLVFRDFSDKKEKRKQIEYLSYHDQLTGLYNRRFFEEELRRLDTGRNLPLSFLYADVNGLKTINDAFGHQYGDMLIQQVSDVFKTECRADDIIARTGGDEFIFLFPKTDPVFVQELTNRIKEKIEQKTIMDISISISFGWDTKHEKNQSVWNVLKNAENIMYQKKIYDSSSKRSDVIRSILHTLHLKSPREEAHAQRVSMICEALGEAYNLSDDEIRELRTAGKLHDIGKIAIDEVVLKNPGKLSDAEWVQIKHHPETGFRLLGTSSEYYNIAEFVLAHHERWDGTGYPNGLKGEDIHWKARIIALADAYDAMTCERSYRNTFSKDEAIAEIRKNAGIQFDPDISRVFIEKVLGGKFD